MKFLGKMRGSGTVTNASGPIGTADFELDGYVVRPGAVVASGELRMASAELERAQGGGQVRLTTPGGTFGLRFTGKPSDRGGDAAHIEISEGLPEEKEWQRLARSSADADD
ncbi:MAG: hypothetical protein ACHQPH_03455 [Reyranellales bacterium]